MNDLINGRTPEEIKKALDYCSHDTCGDNDECAYLDVEIRCWENVMKDALAYIQRLEAAQPKWISVEERLPERYTPVLGCIKKDCTETYIEHVVIFDGSWWAKDTGVYYDDVGGMVTHWMPLPEPPEVEG